MTYLPNNQSVTTSKTTSRPRSRRKVSIASADRAKAKCSNQLGALSLLPFNPHWRAVGAEAFSEVRRTPRARAVAVSCLKFNAGIKREERDSE
jgi:hypothetical protein